MNYPSISDYIEALHDAEDSLSELKDLRLVYDDQGHPIMSSGNFAVVFKMQTPRGVSTTPSSASSVTKRSEVSAIG